MTAYATNQAGAWSNSAIWTPTGVPADTDTATVTHAVTVDANTTVGGSGAAGTAAITVSGSGSLTVNTGVALTVRGDTVLANTVLTLSAGSTYYFDSSLAAGTPRYKIRIGSTNGQTNSKLVCSGTSGSRVTIGKAAGSGNGLIGRGVNGSTTWCPARATYTDFSDLGSTSTGYDNDGVELNGTTGHEIYLDHCVFTRCGRVIVSPAAATDLVFTFNSFSGCIQAGGYLLWTNCAASTTGLRTITDNLLIDGDTANVIVCESNVKNFVFERNYIARAVTTSMSGAAGVATSFADNIYVPRAGNSSNFSMLANPGNNDRSYWMSEAASEISSFSPSLTGAVTITFDGLITETSWAREDMDAFHIQSPTSAQTVNIRRGLVLPNSRGYMSGNYTAHGNKYVTWNIEHCTMMSSQTGVSSTGQACVYIGSGYQGHAGMYPSIRSNLLWNKVEPAAAGWIVWNARPSNSGTADSGTTTTLVDAGVNPQWVTGANVTAGDSALKLLITGKTGSGPEVGETSVVTTGTATTIGFSPALTAAPDTGTGYITGVVDVVTVGDYNATFLLRDGTVYDADGANGASKRGYESLWATSQAAVGAHDITLTGTDETTGGPQFVDSTRNLATFDSAKLGNTATAWADATVYAVGDFVSAATSTFYNNATINYRCVKAHTSEVGHATNGKPGDAATYRTNWEFASAYRLRQGVLNGTTLDGYNYVRALYEWVRAGFSPRNTLLIDAGHDSVTIGAVEGAVASTTQMIICTVTL